MASAVDPASDVDFEMRRRRRDFEAWKEAFSLSPCVRLDVNKARSCRFHEVTLKLSWRHGAQCRHESHLTSGFLRALEGLKWVTELGAADRWAGSGKSGRTALGTST